MPAGSNERDVVALSEALLLRGSGRRTGRARQPGAEGVAETRRVRGSGEERGSEHGGDRDGAPARRAPTVEKTGIRDDGVPPRRHIERLDKNLQGVAHPVETTHGVTSERS